MKKMSQKQKITVVDLKRFSLVKIFTHKLFASQKFTTLQNITGENS